MLTIPKGLPLLKVKDDDSDLKRISITDKTIADKAAVDPMLEKICMPAFKREAAMLVGQRVDYSNQHSSI